MSAEVFANQKREKAPVSVTLPKGWAIKSLGEVVTKIIGGGTPSRDNPAFWNGDIPWLTVKDMRTTRPADSIDHISSLAVEESATNIVPADTIIIATRIGLGKVIRVPYEAAINQDLKALIVPPEMDKSFLEYWLLSIAGYLQSIGFGTTVKGIRLEQLKGLEMPVPPPSEQRRIVAEIEKQFTRLEAGMAALRRTQANLKRYRAAVLKAACEGRLVLTEVDLAKTGNRKGKRETGESLLARILKERRQNWQGRGKYREPAIPDTTKLPKIPEGWTWLTVETIGFVTKLAGFEYTKYVKYSPDGDLAVIKAENAGRRGFKRTEISRIKSSTVAQLTRSQLKAGDLLMVFVGAGTGNVARVPDDQPYFLGPNIATIRVETHNVSGAYLEMFLRSPLGHSLTFSFIKAVAQPSLSMGTIRMIPVALPPLTEQVRIVAEVERRLSVVEELEAVVSANLQRANRLRQSILQKAFNGGLTSNIVERQKQ